MAAYIVTKHKEYQWHINEPLPNSIDIKDVIEVQIDGDEMDIIPIKFDKRVVMLTHNESILYCLLIQSMYKDRKPPTITEEGFNTFLKGTSNPESN